MLIDTKSVSSWYVLHRGFRLTKECRSCQTELTHFKAFEKNYIGIMSRCENCGKEIVKMKSTIHHESPLDRYASIDDETFGRVREGSGLVERFNGSVVELLHS